jgi:hypothetical protein
MSVFNFLANWSVIDSWKTKIFEHQKTEPNSRFKPNVHPYVLMSWIMIDFYGSRLRSWSFLCVTFHLAFLSMHCGFSHQKFHKLRWASTLNQTHLFMITSLFTTQFEYGVKFSMEIQIFRKIMKFILTLAAISPLFYARGQASFKHGEESLHHLWQMLCKNYVAKVLMSKRKKWKMKKIMMRRKEK